MKGKYLIILFCCIICCTAKHATLYEEEGKSKYIILTYQVGTLDGNSHGTSLKFEIDQHNPIVYEVLNNSSPIKHHVENHNDSVTYFYYKGAEDTTYYKHHSDFDIIRKGPVDCDNKYCIEYAIIDRANKLTKKVIVDTSSTYNIRFPLKYLNLNKNHKINFPLFNPEVYDKGIPIRIEIPMSSDRINEAISKQLHHPFIPSGSIKIVKAEIPSVVLVLELINIEKSDEHSIPLLIGR